MKNYRNLKPFILAALFCMILISASVVKAKDVPLLSAESLVLYRNMSEELKVDGADSKVKWSTSDKNIAVVLGTRGEEGNIAVIRTKGRTGTCYIRANVAGRICQCKVTVKGDSKVARAVLKSVKQTKKKIEVKVKLTVRKDLLNFTRDYEMEKFKKGRWVSLKPKKSFVTDAGPAMVMVPGKTKESAVQTYQLLTKYKKSQLGKGTYRLRVDADYADNANNYVVFNLK